MRRWCGWGERLINIMSPEFEGRGEGHALREGASALMGYTTAGELRRLLEKSVPGGVGDRVKRPMRSA